MGSASVDAGLTQTKAKRDLITIRRERKARFYLLAHSFIKTWFKKVISI